MHYYKRNIGDYHKKAGRLSILQHGTYTLLLDACYDREEFPTREQAIDWVWASTQDEIDAVDFVLSRFFDLIDGVYVQNRIQDELDAYHEKSQKNRQIALEREEKRRKRKQAVHETCSNENESSPNHKPLTNNHKPLTNNIGDESPAKAKRFAAPDFQEVAVYFFERTNDRDLSAKEAQKFVSFYESKGWVVGKTKMKDWKAAVRGWISRLSDKPKTAQEQRAESAAKAFDYDYQMNQLEGL